MRNRIAILGLIACILWWPETYSYTKECQDQFDESINSECDTGVIGCE